MKTRLLLVATALLFAFTGSSQAGHGWGGGCGWGGGWHGGWGGGYCGPRFGWGGGWGGWCGPAFGITFAAPLPVYRPVYYVQPAPASYVVYRSVAPSSTLARAQAQLANLGYYRGSVDGSFGPLTSRAITLFQADNGLPVTGRLDRVTLKSLGS